MAGARADLVQLMGGRPEGTNRVCAYSPDGRWIAYATTDE